MTNTSETTGRMIRREPRSEASRTATAAIHSTATNLKRTASIKATLDQLYRHRLITLRQLTARSEAHQKIRQLPGRRLLLRLHLRKFFQNQLFQYQIPLKEVI